MAKTTDICNLLSILTDFIATVSQIIDIEVRSHALDLHTSPPPSPLQRLRMNLFANFRSVLQSSNSKFKQDIMKFRMNTTLLPPSWSSLFLSHFRNRKPKNFGCKDHFLVFTFEVSETITKGRNPIDLSKTTLLPKSQTFKSIDSYMNGIESPIYILRLSIHCSC